MSESFHESAADVIVATPCRLTGPSIITQNGKATAVLVDVESFERQREALLLLRYLAVGEDEIGKGKRVPHEDALHHFERKLKELRGG